MPTLSELMSVENNPTAVAVKSAIDKSGQARRDAEISSSLQVH